MEHIQAVIISLLVAVAFLSALATRIGIPYPILLVVGVVVLLIRELSGLEGVTEIRGQGLMLGIELAQPCGVLTQRAADKGLLISVTADNVIRLVPSLILTPADADEIVAVLAPLVREFLGAT